DPCLRRTVYPRRAAVHRLSHDRTPRRHPRDVPGSDRGVGVRVRRLPGRLPLEPEGRAGARAGARTGGPARPARSAARSRPRGISRPLPRNRQVATPVPPEEIRSPEIQRLIDDMVETMREYDGAGLAANQVHTLRAIAVIEVLANPRYPDAPHIPLTVVINPVVTPIGEETED